MNCTLRPLLVFLSCLPIATVLARPINIGLIDTFDPQFYIYTFTPLIEQLKREHPQLDIHTRELSYEQLKDDSIRRELDYVILSSGHFVSHQSSLGLSEIATRRLSSSSRVDQSVGALFLVRKDREDIQSLQDLQGKRLAIASKESFEGWSIALGEIARAGYDANHFFGQVTETFYQYPDVSMIVKVGLADVGILPTCEFETLVAQAVLDKKQWRIINNQTRPGEACSRSTLLYPDMVFATLPTANDEVTKLLTISLLTMPADSLGHDWLSNNNFVQVDSLLKTLKVGPYEYLRDQTWRALLRRYHDEFILALVIFLGFMIHVIRVNCLVRVRTNQLKKTQQEKERTQQMLSDRQSRLDRMERMGIVNQLSSMLAHELKQPLTNVVNYLSASKLLIDKDNVDKPKLNFALEQAQAEVYRAGELIDKVRSYAKPQEKKNKEQLLLDSVLDSALLHCQSRGDNSVAYQRHGSTHRYLYGDRLELELLVLNLLRNATEAALTTAQPEVIIHVTDTLRTVELLIDDNGPKLNADVFSRMTEPGQTHKKEGMGFGLPIALSIAEHHQASLTFKQLEPQGIRAQLTFYLENDL